MRALLLASLAVAGCDPSYDVATCSFGAGGDACTPVRLAEGPREMFILSFAVLDPNPGIAPGCAGTIDLEVNTVNTGADQLAWHAEELDARCARLGEPIDGVEAIAGETVVDIDFVQRAFTFRVAVVER